MVQYTDDPDEPVEDWDTKVVPGNETSTTLTPEDDGLEPDTPYTVVVTPRNDKGDGPSSEPKTFTTGPGKPTKPVGPTTTPIPGAPKQPKNVQPEVGDDNSVTVTWDEPEDPDEVVEVWDLHIGIIHF